MTDNVSPQQLDAIRRAALERARYILWIAEKLLATEDKLIRQEASKILREMASTE